MNGLQTYIGEYYLQGQREMASGFLLKPGGDFQFFFSYGALDRQGSGKWEVKGDSIVLYCGRRPVSDFALVSSKKTQAKDITIIIDKANPALVRYIYCSLENGLEGTWSPMDGSGEIDLPQQKIEKICLLLEFCAERFSTITVNPEHNEFVFRIEPTIMEVYLENFSLKVSDAGLSGRHPLMEGNEFSYKKQ